MSWRFSPPTHKAWRQSGETIYPDSLNRAGGEPILLENSQKISASNALRLYTSAVAMPPSQLKQLKTSLRETGVLGPQQSKKKKRQNAQSGAAAQNRVQRNAALQGIRERFNPFEVKAPVKSAKFDVTTRDAVSKGGVGHVRPGVTKSLGEERVSFAG